ncbi:MAG: dUTP diphosphatase [Epsilonproteobacteria bacterium]|nr:dUTP diphosphatase [Campylobacterota bacterium]
MNQILQMLKLQQELNDATNGLNWEEGITKNGKKIDWRRCIYLEAAELVESYPWKHWKNIDASPDYENIKIELVDIWHFVMSEALRLYKVEGLGSIEALANNITAMSACELLANGSDEELDNYEQIALVEEMMIKILFCSKDIDELTASFLTVTAKLGLNLAELYALYIGKNILNKFRQEHGYKEGSYIKVWNGQEDNVVMQSLLAQKSDITPDELYTALEEAYPTK